MPKSDRGASSSSRSGSSSGDAAGDADKGGASVKRASVVEVFREATVLDRLMMFVGALAALGSGVSSPLFLFFFGRLSSAAVHGDPQALTREFAVVLSILGAIFFCLTTMQNTFWTLASSRLVGRMKLRFFDAVLRQEMSWHERHRPGELVSRLIGDTQTIINGINENLANGVTSLGTALFGLIFASISSWEITLFALSGFPIAAIMCKVMINFINHFSSKCQEYCTAASALAMEVMENVKTTQVFNMERYEIDRYASLLLSSRTAGIIKQFFISATVGLITASMLVALAGGFVFGSYLVQWGRADVGAIASGFLLSIYGCLGLAAVFPSIISFMEATTAAYEIIKITDRVPPIDIDAPGIPFDQFHHSIAFSGLSFHYEGREEDPIFDGLSFSIRKGEKVAFTGATGSGKSTIVGLLQRLYDPTEGAVLVDGRDLRQLSLYDWRQHMGVVLQEPKLFEGTIVDNIRVGLSKAPMDDVITACKRANIHDTIMQLPHDYYTPMGEGQLSGGERQRLAIARALVKKPTILLLDEATSALDRQSEMGVQKAIDALMEGDGMTLIVVAHRLSTIREMDHIYYLERIPGGGSRITEEGTFNELVYKNGAFAAMVKMQSCASVAPLYTTYGLNNNNSVSNISNNNNVYFNDGEHPYCFLDAYGAITDMYEYENILGPSGHDDYGYFGTFFSNFSGTSNELPFEDRNEWEVDQTRVSFCRIIQLVGRNWALYLGALGSMLNAFIIPGTAAIFSNMVGVLSLYAKNHDLDAMRKGVIINSLFFGGLAVLSFVSSVLQGFYGFFGEHLTFLLRTALFRGILRQDQSFFDMPARNPGALAGVISGDCEIIHQFWGSVVGSIVRIIVLIVGGIVVGVLFQWKVALVASACMPLLLLSTLLRDKIMSSYVSPKTKEALHTITNECFSGIRTVSSFNMKNRMVRRYRRAVAHDKKRVEGLSLFFGLSAGFMQFTVYGTVALAFWYGGILIGESQATFGEVMTASLAVMVSFMNASVEIGGLPRKYLNAKLAAKRVFCIIDRVPDVDVYDEGEEVIAAACDITFENAEFYYPSRPGIPVLDRLDLHFAHGTSNGLIGHTGCGKSTIIGILCRFYDPTGGYVCVNGKDLRDVDIFTWRDNISAVFQEPALFSGTIRENVWYSRQGATDEEVEEACRLACIHDEIINMPDGYDTEVGYQGRELSGGQRQRIAIARGLLRMPKLLLFDEATSALDTVTEAAVQRNLNEFQYQHGITTVTIAHRLTTLQDSDQIVLLDAGRVMEKGTHHELMARSGEYKARWEIS